MSEINWIAVAVAAFSAFLLGGLWYSPLLFGNKWATLSKLPAEQTVERHPAVVYGLSFVLSFVAALFFAMFLGPAPELAFAIGVGAGTGLIWVAGSFGINYLFEQRSFALLAINGSYHTIQFTLYGLVLGGM